MAERHCRIKAAKQPVAFGTIKIACGAVSIYDSHEQLALRQSGTAGEIKARATHFIETAYTPITLLTTSPVGRLVASCAAPCAMRLECSNSFYSAHLLKTKRTNFYNNDLSQLSIRV